MLGQNYPSPFNPNTNISYSIGQSGYISLKVYNLLGEEVIIIYEGFQTSGFYNSTFDGSRLESGVYLYQLKANGFTDTKKRALLK